MNLSLPPPLAPALSRRQFVVAFGGGAALVALGWSSAVVASGAAATDPVRLATGWGHLAVLQGATLARLDTPARAALASAAADAAWLSGATAAVVAATNGSSAGHHSTAVGAVHALSDHAGTRGSVSRTTRWPQPANLTWDGLLVLHVELANTSPLPVMFGPGQLRLALVGPGVTVTAQDADRGAGVLRAGTTESTWISYLVPPDAGGLDLEYTDPHRGDLARLPLSSSAAEAARS